MIVSHRQRFIFFAVPKTATHAIREALRAHLGADDWEQQVLFGKQSLPIADIARLGHGHIAVSEIRPHLSPDVWNGYLKFAFVRNPYDRFVSTCFFLNRGNPSFAATAVTFMKRALSMPRFQQRVLVRPQHRQLCDDNGDLAMDVIGRHESLQDSYDDICRQLHIPGSDLSRKNPSQHAPYVDYYDDELRELVGNFYRQDLDLFGYDFAASPSTN